MSGPAEISLREADGTEHDLWPGNPLPGDVMGGPVISRRAHETYPRAIAT